MVYKAYKFRIFPSPKQENLIIRTFGCTRFIYNYFLNQWNEVNVRNSAVISYESCSAEVPALTKKFLWLKDVDSIALRSAIKNLSIAYSNYLKKGSGSPNFKSKKDSKQSYTTRRTNGNIDIINNKIKIPKLGMVRFAKSTSVEGRILNATISRKSSGSYFVSILVEVEVKPYIKTKQEVGIDLGVKDFAILSNGEKIKNSLFIKDKERKLLKEQRKLSRRKVGSSNWEKQKVKVAKIYESIANERKDFLHKVSTYIVKNNDIISIENLRIRNMMQEDSFAKAISNASWYQFGVMLEYKSNWYGRSFIKVGKTFPSSQLCSKCGHKNSDLKDLKIRNWECAKCGSVWDRDINASINILLEGKRLLNKTAGTAGLA